MRWHPLIPALASLAFLAVPALAERPPQKREAAAVVVVGTVEKIQSADKPFGGDGTMTTYTAEIKVEKVEKGDKVKAGETIKITWFHVTKRPTQPIVGAFGQAHDVKEKGKIRVWLMPPPRGTEAYPVIYNKDGVEKADK